MAAANYDSSRDILRIAANKKDQDKLNYIELKLKKYAVDSGCLREVPSFVT